MRTIAYYIWILERKICTNKRCKTCSKLNENHHCKIWNQKVVKPDNMCILWEKKTKREELKMNNEETKNISKECLIGKINNIENEVDKEKLIDDYGEKYGDFIQKYIESKTSFKSLETGTYASLFSVMTFCVAISITFILSKYTILHCVSIPFVIFMIIVFYKLCYSIKTQNFSGLSEIKKDIIIDIEYNKIKKS